MKYLKAPWRWTFISKMLGEKTCIFCKALKLPEKESLICYRGKQYFIILNKYPYSTGHLLIVPYEHVDSPEKISPEKSIEMWELMNKALKAIKKKFNPDGFNIGMNIGKSAGAGVKNHFHLHLVPRWTGDSNFLAVIGNTKLLSYNIKNVFNTLTEMFNQ